MDDNSRDIPCIGCEGTGLLDPNDLTPCSHCKGTGIEPVTVLVSGFEGSIPPINMPMPSVIKRDVDSND